MKKLIALALLAISITCSAAPIEFVVTASAGGPNDTVTRKIVEKISTETDLTFVVVNKPGAAHVIGYNFTMNSKKPTLILSTPEIANHDVYLQLDELFTVGYFTNTIFVSTKSNITNINQLAELSKHRDVNFGSGGPGTYSHKAMEIVCKSTLKCLSVPYKSGAEGMLAVMTGQIDTYALVSYGSYQFLNNDKVKAIHEIQMLKNDNWLKLFAKNVSNEDREKIMRVLNSLNKEFFYEMGFEKQ